MSSAVHAAPGTTVPALPLAGQLATIGATALAGWLLLHGAGRLLDVRVWEESQRVPLTLGLAVLVAAVAAAAYVGSAPALSGSSLRRVVLHRLLPSLVVGGTAALVSGGAAVALFGTRWSYNATYSDAGFRTEAATRFADSPALADYGYRGLPSYYPPALPWVQGRLADLVGIPAWQAMQPVALVLAVAIPALAYLAWRRVLPDGVAATVVAVTSLLTVDLVKPDEWLVLSVVLPWWLELVRDLRRPGVARRSAWGHGLVLGGLLLTHSYYFVPLTLATLAGLALDAAGRRPMPLRPLRAVAVAVVGVAVASPYWAPMALTRLRGASADDLQRRWSPPGFEVPPLPLPPEADGVLGLLCVAWLALRLAWRPRPAGERGEATPVEPLETRLAHTLAVLLATSYAFFVGGQWLQPFGLALLPEKTDHLIVAVFGVGAVLALREARAALRRRRAGGLPLLEVVVAAVVAAALTATFAGHWMVGRPPLAAQQIRYPDGTYPAGGIPEADTTRHPWSVSPLPTGPSTDEVRAGWRELTGRSLGDESVLVTSRADLLATTPVHPFLSWKSIYSHPYGQFEQRLDLLRRTARCPNPRCTWRLLRDNRFDRVDGLVLNQRPDGLGLTVTTDTFPDGWVQTPVTFDAAALREPWFSRRDVGNVAVVALNRRPAASAARR